MSREEAIDILKDWDGYFIGHSSDDVYDALDMAIKALEQDTIPVEWLEEKLVGHPELCYAVTDGINNVLELWEKEKRKNGE